MKPSRWIMSLATLSVLSLNLAACASVSKVHSPITEDTGVLRLAEVVGRPGTRAEIVQLGPHYQHLLASGIADADLKDGSLVQGRVYCCGGSIEQTSALWAYVPPEMKLETGNIIEVRMGRQPTKGDPGQVNRVERVKHETLTNAPCRWVPERQELWMRVLYCDWMVQEGWIERTGLYKTWLKPAAARNPN